MVGGFSLVGSGGDDGVWYDLGLGQRTLVLVENKSFQLMIIPLQEGSR